MSETGAGGSAAGADAVTARYLRWVADLQQGPQPCFHCGRQITAIDRPGRSIYGRACGCRLYQGTVPDWARPPARQRGRGRTNT